MNITPKDFSEIRWRGHWIWLSEEAVEPAGFWSNDTIQRSKETHALFRRTFSLKKAPERAPARVAADARYALFVNEQEVSRGPIRSQPRRLHYDLFDIAPYLREGANVVAVYVKYYGRPNSFWMPAVPNNTLGTSGVLVFETRLGEDNWLVSDDTWKAHKSSAWDDDWHSSEEDTKGLPVEIFDARCFPQRWRAVDFDDQSWNNAQVVAAMHVGGFARSQPPTDPYGPLYPRPIQGLSGQVVFPETVRVESLAQEVDETIAGPFGRVQASLGLTASEAHESRLPVTLNVRSGRAARLSMDMGGVVSGFVQFSLAAPAGTVVDLAYSEEPLQAALSMDKMRAGSRYIARGKDDDFELFDCNGFRYATILLHGIEGAVTLHRFAVREHLYPWEGEAAFRCDDEALNRIFNAGVRTVQLCSQDAFVDCPTREQRAWVGDGVVHQMVHLATNEDWRLAWRFLTLGNSPRSDGILPMSVASDMERRGAYTIPDWSLHWLHGVYNLYRFSGDQAVVKSLLPTAELILRWYTPYQTEDGVLKDVPEWNLVDWSSVSTEDTSAVLTGLWARGLREFAEMAGWLEEIGSQKWADALSEQARAGFELFWDERRGSYIDHIVDGVRQPEMSQLPGALAIVSGLAPEERWKRIVETITDSERLVVRSWMGDGSGRQSMRKWQQQVRQGLYEIDWDAEQEIVLAQPFMSYVVHDAIAAAGCADLLPALYRRWLQFFADGYDTIGECWDFGTHAHGWSCTPTRDMIFYTLGVTPAEPGYTKVRVAPRLGSLRWAKGRAPTPHGVVAVEVTQEGVLIESPVPVVLELPERDPEYLAPGKHEVSTVTPDHPSSG